MVGKGRHNYHEESEASINKQINMELNAHYQYLALVNVKTYIDIFLWIFKKCCITPLFRLPIMIKMTWL